MADVCEVCQVRVTFTVRVASGACVRVGGCVCVCVCVCACVCVRGCVYACRVAGDEWEICATCLRCLHSTWCRNTRVCMVVAGGDVCVVRNMCDVCQACRFLSACVLGLCVRVCVDGCLSVCMSVSVCVCVCVGGGVRGFKVTAVKAGRGLGQQYAGGRGRGVKVRGVKGWEGFGMTVCAR